MKFATLTALFLLSCGNVWADVPLDITDLVSAPTVAPGSEHSFTVSSAQALTVTLTDFQTPAAFQSLEIGVTLGDALVGMPATVNPATHTATLQLPSATGNYVLHVIGTPNAAQGIGSFGACVAPATSVTSCVAAYSYSDTLLTPITPSTTPSSALNTNFTSTVAGTYTVTVTDDVFPVALQSIAVGIAEGSTPINVPAFSFGANPITLAAGTNYTLVVGALADATAQAGLYGLKITDPTGAVIFNRTLPVGTLGAPASVNNSTAQAVNLSLNDFAYPAALSGVGVVITEGSTALAKLTASGTLSNVAAPAGTMQIWQYAVANAQPGVYSINLATSGTSLYSVTNVVNPTGAAAGQSYAFAVNLPSAGTYNLVVHDLQFPAGLTSISSTIAQNGAALTVSSSGDFTAAAGYVIVVVAAQPPQSGSGIFGVTVQTSGSAPQILLDQTQAVGGVFVTRTVALGTSGNYDVTLTDLGFPTPFQSLALVATRGSQVEGKIFGGGPFTLAATPGNYVLTFVATPGAQNYGLYSIRMASSAPTVTFKAATSSVVAGQPVQLTWSTQNATSCTAGGDSHWTGSQPTSGTLAVAIDASETLTLTCTGPGGSAAQSVSIVTTAAAATKSGGGGGLDLGLLALLGALTLCRSFAKLPRARVRGADLVTQL